VYCSNCGNSVNKKLKYCNNCGERLDREVDKDGLPGKMLDNVLTTLFLVVMFGMGILVGLVAVLLGNNVQTQVVVVIVLAYLAAVFGICFSLLGHVRTLIHAKLQERRAVGYSPDAPELLTPKITGQLDEYREPAISVTENTTRTLGRVPIDRG
jgi:hypothetical protein